MKAKFTFAWLCLCLFFSNELIAQTEPVQKLYWDYRDRLKRNFMKVGPDVGESMPMEWFDYDADCRPTANQGPPTYKGVIHWADGTTYLGDYIGVLATEYRLLKNSNQDASATLSELYYALNAVNRVDKDAERYLINNINHPDDLNGFFMRDDVKPTFKDHWMDRYSYTLDRRDYVTAVSSSYGKEIEVDGCIDYPGGHYNEFNEESQDQLYYLIQGLALVKKLVDNEFVKPTPNDAGFFVVDEAKNIANRLADYVFAEKSTSIPFDPAVASASMLPIFLPVLAPLLLTFDPLIIAPIATSLTVPAAFLLTSDHDLDLYDMTYCIKNPISDKMVESGGGWVQPFAYPFTQCIKFITGRTNFPNVKANVHLQNTSHLFSTAVTDYPKDWWESFRDHTGNFNTFVMNCGPVLGDFSLDMTSYFDNDYNKYMTLLLASVSDTWTPAEIHSHAQPEGMISPELVNAVLYDHATPNTDPNYYKAFLDAAPCEGPSEFATNDWNHPNRWSSPSTTRMGYYNGLDYMLFYNLYRLKFEQSHPNYFTNYSPSNSCPCTFSTVVEGSNMTFGPTQVIELNATGNNHDLLQSQITISPPFMHSGQNEYAEKGISTMDYLSHNLTIEGNGRMTVLSQLAVCNNSTLEIKNYNGLIVGDGTMSGSLVTVRSGSTLIIRSLGGIYVNDKAKIVVEPGGHFIYEPSAQIMLHGKDALLDIQDMNSTIVINAGQSLQLSNGFTQDEGGTMQLAGGTFTMNPGAAILNLDCKLILKAPVVFSASPNVIFNMPGQHCIMDVSGYTDITIGTGKEISIIGFQGSPNGELYLRNGKFRIKNGGKVRNDMCDLHFGADMDFYYEQGAVLELNGSVATADIGGDLFLENNAVFEFSNNTMIDANSGYIRMSAPPYWNQGGSTNVWCGSNCKFNLQGRGKTDKVLEIDQETLYDPTCAGGTHGNLKQFRISNGMVELGAGSRLALAGPCQLTDACFKNRDASSWRNVVVFGQNNVVIDNSSFEGADQGILGALFLGHRLLVTGCTFYNCGAGISKFNGGADIMRCTFNQCTDAYKSLGGTFTDNITSNNVVNGLYAGFSLELGTTGSEYTLTKNNVHGTLVPVSVGGGNINLRCNTITGNQYEAMEAYDHANLNLSSDRSAGYNDMSYNDLNSGNQNIYTLALDGSGYLDLQDGYNKLTPSHTLCSPASSWCNAGCAEVLGSNISGLPNLFKPDCVPGATSQNYPVLIADYNQWTDNAAQAFTSLCYGNLYNAYNCTGNTTSQPIVLVDQSPMSSTQACGVHDNGIGSSHRNALLSCTKCDMVPVSSNSTLRLDDALKSGIRMIDPSVHQYTQAIDHFISILNYKPAVPYDQDELKLITLAYIYLHTAFSRAIDSKQIAVLPPYTTMDAKAAKMITFQKNQVSKAVANSNYPERFYGSLDLANAYRMIEMRDSALNVYNTMLTFASASDSMLVNDWLCYVSAEKNYCKGIVSLNDLMQAGSGCFIGSRGHRYASGIAQHPSTENHQYENQKIIVFPNPATSAITISLVNISGAKSLTVYDCLGNMIRSYDRVPGDEIVEDVTSYPKGVYLLKAENGTDVFSTRFVVE